MRAFSVCDFRFRSALFQKSQFDRNFFLVGRQSQVSECVHGQTLLVHRVLGELCWMKLKLFAGALALTALFGAPNFAPPVQAAELALTESTQPRINISRIKG